ncbi:MAG: hypothetical protein IJN90_08155 [Bacilli bacterium]|nr:hypothetical protein [Bacilli bacterium]
MICTSSYKAWNDTLSTCYSISGDRGKGVNYEGKCYPKLAPKLSFWKKWHDNIGLITEEENNSFYIREYYNQILSKLNPKEVYDELDNSTLLCYEDSNLFCHRHIVAEWLELTLGVSIYEVEFVNGEIKFVDRDKFIGEVLSSVIDKKKVKKKGYGE